MDDDLDEGAPSGASDTSTESTGPSIEDEVLSAIGLGEGGTTDDNTVEVDAVEVPAAGGVAAQGADAQVAAQAGDAAAAQAQAQAAAAGKDKNAELYAPLPEHNPRKTHERFQKLIEGHKSQEAEIEALRPIKAQAEQLQAKVAEHEQGWQVFQEMGFVGNEAVQDLGQFAQYRNALSAGNWDAAAQVIQQQARQLALLSGRAIDLDPLTGFDDLQQRVQAGQLDEPTALELARARHVQGLQHQHQQRQQQVNDGQRQQVQTIHAAALEVDGVVQQLMRDPDFQAVLPALEKVLPDIKANYPPQLWPREVKRAYDTEARFLRLQSQQQTLPNNPAPLRASGHAGGQPVPKTMGDAVLQSLGLA